MVATRLGGELTAQDQQERLRARADGDAAVLADARAQGEEQQAELTEARGIVEKQPYTRDQAQAMNADRCAHVCRALPPLFGG